MMYLPVPVFCAIIFPRSMSLRIVWIETPHLNANCPVPIHLVAETGPTASLTAGGETMVTFAADFDLGVRKETRTGGTTVFFAGPDRFVFLDVFFVTLNSPY
jgi:hypothetical protein